MTKKLKIYFACSIRGEQGGLEDKAFIVSSLKKLGHDVISEIFATQSRQNNDMATKTPIQIYERDMGWIESSDMIVADVSRISMGVGYEIGWMIQKGDPVLALCQEDKYDLLSNMIKGCSAKNFKIIIWKDYEDLNNKLTEEIKKYE